ncbi:hypothetical protein [Halalkalibacterium ligniniphilum]|uniref:hypothetical protein n=1 Tax=Halalkalibacterium ligniniphilum TaxID=1134413 RepID=UPI00034C9FBE|nr:hypothetical protein [Halalkalibacterium ligniniphilum]
MFINEAELTDIERKTRTIIRNMSWYGKLASVEDLSVKTGRKRENILPVIESLVEKKLIKWINKEHVIYLPLPSWYERELKDKESTLERW